MRKFGAVAVIAVTVRARAIRRPRTQPTFFAAIATAIDGTNFIRAAGTRRNLFLKACIERVVTMFAVARIHTPTPNIATVRKSSRAAAPLRRLAAAFAALTTISNASLAQMVTFELNNTRFHIPPAWTITPIHARPAYEPKVAPPENAVFKVDRTIMLGFPHVAAHPDWSQRYPEITPPFIYELVLEPGPKDLAQLRQRPRDQTNPEFARAVTERTADEDGFVRLGPESFVAARPDDVTGAGGFLHFSCRPDLTEKDRGIASRCTVYDSVLDGIAFRASFDGVDFRKPQWRALLKRTHAFVQWLATDPSRRSARFE